MSENTQDQRSDVEKFYDAIAAKFGVTKKYHELQPMEQMQLVQAINIIIQIVRN